MMQITKMLSSSILLYDDEVLYLLLLRLSQMVRLEQLAMQLGKIPEQLHILISLLTKSEKSLYDLLRAESFRCGAKGAIIMDIMMTVGYMLIYTELLLYIVLGMALLADE